MTSNIRLPKPLYVLLISILWILSLSVSIGETSDDTSLGVITSSGSLAINGRIAATGTTLFFGDTIETREGAALIRFHNGTRVELVKARAALKSEGQALILHCYAGLIRFNIQERVDTRILAGPFQLTSSDSASSTTGGLALNQNGQLSVTLCSGKLRVTNEEEVFEITPENPLLILKQSGLGRLRPAGDSLMDGTKSWRADDLKGKMVRVGNETHEILWNSENTLTIDGAWEKPAGWYNYEIRHPSNAQLLPEIPINCMTPDSLGTIAPAAAAIVGVGAGTAVGIAVRNKSESSRSSAVPPRQ